VGEGLCPGAAETGFEEACDSFYGKHLNSTLEDVQCSVVLAYTLTPIPAGQKLRRSLQNANAIDIGVNVSGTPLEADGAGNLTASLVRSDHGREFGRLYLDSEV